MPQASDELRSEWNNETAFERLDGKCGFLPGGYIHASAYHPLDETDLRALDYLIQEWDYEFDPWPVVWNFQLGRWEKLKLWMRHSSSHWTKNIPSDVWDKLDNDYVAPPDTGLDAIWGIDLNFCEDPPPSINKSILKTIYSNDPIGFIVLVALIVIGVFLIVFDLV